MRGLRGMDLSKSKLESYILRGEMCVDIMVHSGC